MLILLFFSVSLQKMCQTVIKIIPQIFVNINKKMYFCRKIDIYS